MGDKQSINIGNIQEWSNVLSEKRQLASSDIVFKTLVRFKAKRENLEEVLEGRWTRGGWDAGNIELEDGLILRIGVSPMTFRSDKQSYVFDASRKALIIEGVHPTYGSYTVEIFA